MSSADASTHARFDDNTIERARTKESANETSAYRRQSRDPDVESYFSEKEDNVRESDFKKRQVSLCT